MVSRSRFLGVREDECWIPRNPKLRKGDELCSILASFCDKRAGMSCGGLDIEPVSDLGLILRSKMGSLSSTKMAQPEQQPL